MTPLHANDRPGRHAPSWYAATAGPPGPFPPLAGDRRADVAVVGGGYTGLSAALHCAQRGAEVVLLDAHRVGWGASGRNGGQVGTGQRQSPAWLERRMGAQAARALWELGDAAAALTFALAEGADARPRRGLAAIARSPASARRLMAEADHLDRAHGHPLQRLDRDAARALVPARGVEAALLDPSGGHLHPLAYAFGLARMAAAAGARIHEGTEVLRVDGGTVHAARGRVLADHVVLATNGYGTRLDRRTAARVLPINNFVAATAPLRDPDAVLARDVAVHDDRFVVNYWRLTHDDRLLFGGGESYGTRFPRDVAAKVRAPMLDLYPHLAGTPIEHAWGGTLAITRTRMPHFRRDGPLYAASGYSGHGVAMATMAGKLVADAIAGDPARFDLMASAPTPRFPGGAAARAPLLALAMAFFAARDRLGV